MINSINGFEESSIGSMVMDGRVVSDDGSIDWDATDRLRDQMPIYIDHEKDMISFKMMTKPASEGGSGCQVTDLVEVALYQLKYFHAKFPCRENALTITKWEEGLMWQRERTRDRLARNVEGRSEK